MTYVLIDFDNGTWRAQGLQGFQLREFSPGIRWDERRPTPYMQRTGTDGPTLDKLKADVSRQAHESVGGRFEMVQYVYTNRAHARYQQLLEEHHARTT